MKKGAVKNPNLICNKYGVWCSNFTDPAGLRVRRSLRVRDEELAGLRVSKMMTEAYEKGYFEMKKPQKVFFKDLAQRVLDYAKDRKRCYKKIYVPVIKHLVDFFGSKCLHEITASQINTYQEERKKSVALVTVNKEVSILSRCFSLAIQWSLSQINPVKGIEHFKIPKNRIRFLSVEEINRLLQSCNGNIRDIILTALHTGGRKSEVLGLRWENIDLENKLVVFERTKNDDVRQIPMTDALYVMFTNRRSSCPKGDYVFPGKAEKPLVDIRYPFKLALKSAGIDACVFHQLRHTYASQLVMSGADILTVKELLGHADIQTTLIYSHLSKKHKIDAVKTYENHLSKIISFRQEIGRVVTSGSGAE